MSAPTRRRRVEIYFILYLAALVLLMPDIGKESNGNSPEYSGVRLDLQPERLRLQCRFSRDSSGDVFLTTFDSTNTIKYFGNVTDMLVSATIEDAATGVRTTIDEASSGLFTLSHDPQRAVIRFVWHPSLLDPIERTFRVTLYASGTPQINSPRGLVNSQPSPGLQVHAATQFVLSTTVDDRTLSPEIIRIESRVDTVVLNDQGAPPALRDGAGGLGAFWIDAASQRLFELPGVRWTNRISVSGADPTRDLRSLPRVRATSTDSRQVTNPSIRFDERMRSIVVEGITPATGVVTLVVTATRRDGEVATTQFSVEPQSLVQLQIPSAFHPGVEYVIQTRLPALPGREVNAAIREGQNWRVQPTSADVIRFTPAVGDTGSIVYVERYIDKEKVSSDAVRIRRFDPPDIIEVRRIPDSDKRRIIVRFGGKHNRPRLDVIEGNVTVRKLYGELRRANPNEQPAVTWIEEFEIEPRDGARPLTYRLQAVDASGARSRIASHTE